MARETKAQLSIPAKGSESVPYATHREIVQGLLLHGVEKFSAELTGAGGIGASFVCPFEPAEIEIYVPATPLAQKQGPGTIGGAGVNLITGAAAAAVATVTAVDANDKSQGFTVAVPTGILGDAAVGWVSCTGYRDVGGSL